MTSHPFIPALDANKINAKLNHTEQTPHESAMQTDQQLMFGQYDPKTAKLRQQNLQLEQKPALQAKFDGDKITLAQVRAAEQKPHSTQHCTQSTNWLLAAKEHPFIKKLRHN